MSNLHFGCFTYSIKKKKKIFASPTTKSILAAIRAVTPISKNIHDDKEGGCLLIVLNYTGDRLNFGMACELANAEGRRCKVVIVSDDCAIARTGSTTSSRKHTGARGVAGCILVIKAAGAAAAAGKSLEEVANIANCVADRIGTLGVALNPVTLPGAAQRNTRLDGGKIEIGLGIHGEAGIRQTAMMPADEIAKEMVDKIYDYGYKVGTSISGSEQMVEKIKEGEKVAIIVNNLGGTSNFELFLLARSIIVYLEEKVQCKVTRAYVGAFMTSFNMHGVSLTIFAPTGTNDSIETIYMLLDAETDASGTYLIDDPLPSPFFFNLFVFWVLR
jgi:dihydroxyacetone kinase